VKLPADSLTISHLSSRWCAGLADTLVLTYPCRSPTKTVSSKVLHLHPR
jgi:hypothetical protein